MVKIIYIWIVYSKLQQKTIKQKIKQSRWFIITSSKDHAHFQFDPNTDIFVP